jgi:hypothetical protein
MPTRKTFSILLASLFLSTAAYANTTATCMGVLIVTLGADGPDQMTAVQGRFTLEMKEDKTATMKLEAKNQPPIIGTGKETGNEDAPWSLSAKDADNMKFSGKLSPIQGLNPQDTAMYMILELKSKALMISGPMACEFGAPPAAE